MKEAKKYLLDIGFDDTHLPLLFNDDDKSYYTVMELMHAYADHKLKLLGIADVIVSCCEPIGEGFFLGISCLKCKQPFRKVIE